MGDFVLGLVKLVFFLFDKTNNVIVFVPAFCLFWSFTWSLVSRLIRGRYHV